MHAKISLHQIKTAVLVEINFPRTAVLIFLAFLIAEADDGFRRQTCYQRKHREADRGISDRPRIYDHHVIRTKDCATDIHILMVRTHMKKDENKCPTPNKKQDIVVREDPKLKKVKDLPSEVLAAAIRDVLHKGK